MDNPDQKIARLDRSLAQAHAEVREVLHQIHYLSESLRDLRMHLDVVRHLREAENRDREAEEAKRRLDQRLADKAKP